MIRLFAGATLFILACRSPSSAPEAKGAIVPPDGGDQVQIGTGSHPVLIKVDPATTGSQGVFAFQLTLGPNDSLPVHRHHRDDELFFVHTGGVTALVGDERKPAPAGTTLFIPAGTPVGLHNPGTATAVLLVIFAAPHMAEYIRSLGHAPGSTPPSLSDDELEEIRKRHHITFP
jgi:mannose-6-phosphate isomerase-like protein (cupin superfamily)